MSLRIPINPPPYFGTLTCLDCGVPDVPKAGPTSKRCPDCQAVATVRQKRANYQRTAEHQKAQRRARYAERADHQRAYSRTYQYGLYPAMVESMLASQDGKCPVCDQPLPIDRLHVDHCHETGVVRGLLHPQCNQALGLLRDSPETCMRAAEYLSGDPLFPHVVQRAPLLTVPATTCTVCGREGTRSFRQQENGTWRCFNTTKCTRRAARQERGENPVGRRRVPA